MEVILPDIAKEMEINGSAACLFSSKVIFFTVLNTEVFSSKIIIRIETFLLSSQSEINRGGLLKTCIFCFDLVSGILITSTSNHASVSPFIFLSLIESSLRAEKPNEGNLCHRQR